VAAEPRVDADVRLGGGGGLARRGGEGAPDTYLSFKDFFFLNTQESCVSFH
jgi:hypothetical protein